MNRSIPAITAILVIFLGLFAGYLVYQRASKPDAGSLTAAIPEAITASSTEVSAASSSPSVKAPARTTKASSSGVSVTVPASSEKSRSAAESNSSNSGEDISGRHCTANDLSASATWERTGAYLTGVLKIKNNASSDCVLSRLSSLSVFSGYKLLSDNQTSKPAQDVLAARGQEIPVRFTWSNWCGGALSNPAYIVYSLPGSAGYLRVPLISLGGNPQYETPSCASGRASSSIDVWW